MDKINFVIADNIKRIREQRKLSLDSMSKLCYVSKSMLGQIERGEVNPTISTVWKIAKGLKVSFTELIKEHEVDCAILKKESLQPLFGIDGKYRNFPLFSFDDRRRAEMLYIELDPRSSSTSEAHPEGTEEFLTLFSGILCVKVDGKELILQDGDSLRFKANYTHTYCNLSDSVCRFSMVIFYPE